ncbi:MAG: hypothetical protein RLZZ106_136 [Cyanobacteriota bacterium]|jgi:hypothetical protein
MNRTEMHPVELALVAGLVVLEAAITLLVALAALLLTLARWRPAAPAPTPAQASPAAPVEPIAASPAVALHHPLVELALEALQPLTVAQLRSRARAAGLPRNITRTGRRAELVEALVAMELAMA